MGVTGNDKRQGDFIPATLRTGGEQRLNGSKRFLKGAQPPSIVQTLGLDHLPGSQGFPGISIIVPGPHLSFRTTA